MTRNRPHPLLVLVFALVGVFVGPRARAQDTGPEEPPARPPVVFSGRASYISQEIRDGRLAVHFVGDVQLAREGFAITARNLVLWVDPAALREGGGSLVEGLMLPAPAPADDGERTRPAAPRAPDAGQVARSLDETLPPRLQEILGPVVLGLYAEGPIVFRIGTRTIRAEERLFVDFVDDIMTTGRVQLSTSVAITGRGARLPLILRAERLRRTSRTTLLLEDASYTTCDFEDPHFRFRCSELAITDYPDHTVFTAWDNVLEIGSVPVFYLPVLGGRSDWSARPLRSVSYSRSSRFGNDVELTWGDDVVLKEGKWGEWRLHTDLRDERGPGFGGDLDYAYGEYRGLIELYSQRDTADQDQFNDTPVPREERGQVHWEHRHRIGNEWRFDLSLYDFSDRNYRPEYHRDDSLSARDPETYARLRRREGIDVVTLDADLRLDSFTSRTERLPRAAFHRIGAPLPGRRAWGSVLDDLTWSLEASVGVLERRFDEALAAPATDDVVRQDAALRLEGGRSLGAFRLAPFAVAGATRWQGRGLPGEVRHADRADLTVGARLGTEAWRDFGDVRNDFLDLRGLRHRSQLELLWLHRLAVTEDAADLPAMDRTDTLDEAEALVLRLRQRLQTERDGRRVDWVDFEVRAYHFPGGLDPGASPQLPREEGVDGTRYQDLVGEEKYRAAPLRGPWGPYEADLRVRLRENLFLLGEAEYDPYAKVTRTFATGLRWFVLPTATVWIGNRRIAGDSNIYTLRADWAVSDRWSVGVVQQSNQRTGRGLVTDLFLRRIFHDIVVEIGFESDRTGEERRVRMSILPTALWTAPTSVEKAGDLDFEARRWYR